MAAHAPSSDIKIVVPILDYVYPIAIVVYFFAATTVSACRLQKPKNGKLIARLRIVVLSTLFAFLLAYVGQGVIYISRAIIQHGWWAREDRVIEVLGSMLVWGCFSLHLLATPTPIWHPALGCWILALGFEATLLALAAVKETPSRFDKAVCAFQTFRIVSLLLLCVLGTLLCTSRGDEDKPKDEEQEPLLNGSTTQANGTADYGTTSSDDSGSDDSDGEDSPKENDKDKEIKEQQRKRLEEEGGWWGYLKGFSVFLPYLWPNTWFLQGCLVVVIIGLLADRVMNILEPRQVGILTDKLTEYQATGRIPWKEFLIWIMLRWISSGGGYSIVADLAKMQVELYSRARVSEMAFNHVMSLSMDFHSNKDSGEVMRSMQQGQSMTDLIELAIFEIGPVFFDLIIAMGYVTFLFNAYAAFILVVAGVVYTYMGIRMTEWIRPKRQTYRDNDREQFKTLHKSVGNWETVSYFNRSMYEEGRYKTATKNAVRSENSYYISAEFSWAAQSFVMAFSLMAASFLAVYQISKGEKPVGNFVTLMLYWNQLMYPLHVVSTSYRRMSSTLIDAERLLQLLRTKPTVTEAPDAKDLQVTEGCVKFDNVDFSYDERKQTLKQINFTAEPGKTIAFVGETGGGKSTMLKLIFRFYDVSGGSIKIDGQDIRDVTIHSLRESLGVVPQDPSLFNESIADNIRYARLEATQAEIEEVCKAAAVHDKIETFPDKYKSKVGERGVKLSGGEKQRVAIARVLLKNPKIVLLDEATSAVDSSTEEQIQEAFRKLSSGRTTFVIAHRLSTIMDADMILVVDHGEIIERGTHDELLLKGGKYLELWTKQTEGKRSKATTRAPTPERPDTGNSHQPLIMINDLPAGQYSEELKKSFAALGPEGNPLEHISKPSEDKGNAGGAETGK